MHPALPSVDPTAAPARSETFNIVSHGAGTVLAAVGLVALLRHAESPRASWAMGIYGSSLCLLFLASTLYHARPRSGRLSVWLERADHVCIFLLIAGTYTPPCLLWVPPAWGWPVLAAVWALAVVGIGLRLFRPRTSKRTRLILYLGMGWAVLAALPALLAHVPPRGLALLVAGGVTYTLGAAVYARQRPDPLPAWLGFHGLWHILVLLASGFHFAFVMLDVPMN